MNTNDPLPAEELREYIATAISERIKQASVPAAGEFVSLLAATEHDLADAALKGLHRWEAQGTFHRLCIIPSCFKQFHVLEGAPGWKHSTAVGYMCPAHVPLLWADGDASHVPQWGYQRPEDPEHSDALLRCTCGWDAGRTRFRAHGTTLWQAHALEVLEASR
jgi:hypothetical protein